MTSVLVFCLILEGKYRFYFKSCWLWDVVLTCDTLKHLRVVSSLLKGTFPHSPSENIISGAIITAQQSIFADFLRNFDVSESSVYFSRHKRTHFLLLRLTATLPRLCSTGLRQRVASSLAQRSVPLSDPVRGRGDLRPRPHPRQWCHPEPRPPPEDVHRRLLG